MFHDAQLKNCRWKCLSSRSCNMCTTQYVLLHLLPFCLADNKCPAVILPKWLVLCIWATFYRITKYWHDFWHERAAFQQSAFWQLTDGNGIVATIFIFFLDAYASLWSTLSLTQWVSESVTKMENQEFYNLSLSFPLSQSPCFSLSLSLLSLFSPFSLSSPLFLSSLLFLSLFPLLFLSVSQS